MLIRFYKPYGVLSQFRRNGERSTLADFIRHQGVHPAGRLDMDSEGLLLLTDDGGLQARIAEPRYKLPKTYLVQVEARPAPAAFERAVHRLVTGIALRDGIARAVSARQIDPPDVADRVPPVTPHRAGRSSWVEVVLTEGRNRQVRRMLAAEGMPVLRLLRTRIGPFDLQDLAPGQWAEVQVPAELRSRPTRPGGRRPSREDPRATGRRPRRSRPRANRLPSTD